MIAERMFKREVIIWRTTNIKMKLSFSTLRKAMNMNNMKKIIGLAICILLILCLPFGCNLFVCKVKAAEITADTTWYYEDEVQDAKKYSIKTVEELLGLSELTNNKGEDFFGWEISLGDDIDLSDIENWPSIGYFTGSFDGAGHIISNMKQSVANNGYNGINAGLFADCEGYMEPIDDMWSGVKALYTTTIKNVTLNKPSIVVTGSNYCNRQNMGVGSLVGCGFNIIIENCHVINPTIQNGRVYNTGGIIGSANRIQLNNCTVENADITSEVFYTGMLAGRVYNNAMSGWDKEFCQANSVKNVTVQGKVSGAGYTGGIAGQMTDECYEDATFEFLTVLKGSTITGTNERTAGIVPVFSRKISHVYNGGDVVGTINVSGIAAPLGMQCPESIIENAINIGEVNGTDSVAGIVAANDMQISSTSLTINSSVNYGNTIIAEGGSGNGFANVNDKCPLIVNKSCYLDLNATEETASAQPAGLSIEQFKDRTAVNILNDENNPIWFQNVDYPDFADNMIPVTGITADDTASVDMDQDITLAVSVTPEDATNRVLTFKSSDEEVATVDADGKVKGIKAGEADITITALYDGSQKVCKVTVKDPVAEKEKADKEAADKVIEMIKGIDITKATEAQLKAVQNAYNALTDDQKKLVDADSEAAEAMKKIDAKVEEMEKESSSSDKKDSTTVAVKKGATFTVKGYKYKVTSNLKKNPTVTVTGYKNKKLKKIVVPASVKYKKVTFKVTAIGKGAFKNQKKANSIVVGKNVKNIGASAFEGDIKLVKITVRTSQLTKVGAKALKKTPKLKTIKVPKKKVKKYKKLFKGRGQKKTVKIIK